MNGKILHVYGLEELTLLKFPNCAKQLQSQYNPYENSNDIFHRTKRNNSKICMKHKTSWIAKTILKKNKAGIITPLTSDYSTKQQ